MPHKKPNLPTKTCPVCNLPFTWRKKWEKKWDGVKYCPEKCRRNERQNPRDDISPEHSQIIEMAWCDETTFDVIFAQTGLQEKEVIKIMRTYMKPSSFRMWRKRVSGRKSKHAKIS